MIVLLPTVKSAFEALAFARLHCLQLSARHTALSVADHALRNTRQFSWIAEDHGAHRGNHVESSGLAQDAGLRDGTGSNSTGP